MTEQKILEILVDLANGLEALAVNVKHQIAQIVEISEPRWNPDKIIWTEATGEKGIYERSEDVNNLQFKAMLRDLNNHGGKMNRHGHFYWVFKNGSIVGRKKR